MSVLTSFALIVRDSGDTENAELELQVRFRKACERHLTATESMSVRTGRWRRFSLAMTLGSSISSIAWPCVRSPLRFK